MFKKRLRLLLPVLAAAAMALLPACSNIGKVKYKEGEPVISEVMTSNSNVLIHDKLGSPDWIELYNPGTTDINLEGYVLRNPGKVTVYYQFPDVTLKSGEYLIVYCCDGQKAPEELCTGFNLSKEQASVVLMDSHLMTIQELNIPELHTDVSYCLTDGTYKYCMTPTPGEVNTGLMSDDSNEISEEYIDAGAIINEANSQWVEIYNASDEPCDLSAYRLSDNPSKLSKWAFPQITLEPGKYLVVSLTGSGELYTNFGIGADEDSIYLSIAGKVISEFPVNGIFEGMSVGFNEAGEKVYFGEPTPGAPNSDKYYASLSPEPMTEADPVKINEVLLKNKYSLIDENGARSQWVELWNSSSAPVSLHSYYLSDDPNNPIKWQFPDEVLPAGGYKVVFMTSESQDENHTGFSVGKGEPVILTDFATMHSQKIEIPDSERLDNISYGVQDGEWKYFGKSTPGLPNTTHGTKTAENDQKLYPNSFYISEVCASSAPRSGDADWIELYNGTDDEIDLSDYYLSNDIDNPKLWNMVGTISPKSYKVISATAKAGERSDSMAPFGIAQSGEELVITSSSGRVIDFFDSGAQRYGVTSGRAPSDYSGDRVFFTSSSRGSVNPTGIAGYAPAPVFSKEGGFYKDSFTLEIFGDGRIYYTTDGSDPTENSTLYTGPITISKNTPISARAYVDGLIKSEKVVATYLFEDKHTLPVFCMTINPSDFNAIYQNINKRTGIVVERSCYMEYYEDDGKLATSFPAGTRVSGDSTRDLDQKSLGIFLRSGYGQTSVTYPFFEDYDIKEFSSLVIRQAGQNYDGARMADVYTSMIAKRFNTDYAESKFVILYVNGRYWGIYDLKENQNEDFFESRYGVDGSQSNIVRRNSHTLAGSNSRILSVYDYAKYTDLSVQSNYEQFCKWVDTDAFIDHIIMQTYCGNIDIFNQKYWWMDDLSVKIRPVFYDLDYGFVYASSNVLADYFSGAGVPSVDGSLTNMWIPTALLKNAGWRNELINRMAEAVNHGFDDALDIFDKMAAQLKPEMERHIARWHAPSSMDSWQRSVSSMRNSVAARKENMMKYMRDFFSLSADKMHELFPEYY
ncbi:MAG: lamin tail domain-containing protein [Lachnospiraceae bacterium]|nr:lamin tail domain-containing protein [Candidatus Minthocola equi]